MRKLLAICVAVAFIVAVNVSSALASMASISGTVTPTHWQSPTYGWATADFGIIADTANIVDAQSQNIVVTGTIGTLPLNVDYWLEIGLVPKSVYDSPDYDFLLKPAEIEEYLEIIEKLD